MKPLIFIYFLLLLHAGCTETKSTIPWYRKTFNEKGLDKKYQLDSFLKPSFLEADFNGDGTIDIALSISEKSTNKKGILLIHNSSNEFYVFGAGTNFGDGGKDFNWIDNRELYKEKTAFETQFDHETGDIIGCKEIILANTGIMAAQYEDGAPTAGGIIYWTGKNYTWIHQGG